MFIGLLLLVSALVLAYVAWRTASVPWFARGPRRRLWVAFAGAWGLMVAGGILGHEATFPGAGWVALAGMTLLGLLFLAFACLLAVDLATGFGWWFRAAAPRLRGWALLASLGLAAAATVQGLRPPEIVAYEVRLPGLPPERDGLVVAALSDLHVGAILGPDWLAARVAQVQALRPDLVVLLGDVFEGHGRPAPRSIQSLGDLRAPLGVWGVDGNHEHYGVAGAPLESAGVRVLRNALASPVPGLVLAGRADAGRSLRQAAWAVPRERPEGALVLLSHRPTQLEPAARSGVGLMLAGHTHAGQIWPFGYLVVRVYPTLAGRAQVGDMTLIVSRGTGTWGPRMRLWRRGEISLIRLRPAEAGRPEGRIHSGGTENAEGRR
ncbi:metallophosphoesterase [Geothrix mesophila]|uniref:metallophosphoesterase n=1 Tax=Geothrix mesophila TaxID=2922723 RepID=UPI001FABE033|nr:metallophosphoesterase [Geothrix sp. SG198]